ncbi:MAG: FecR domain-containing protein, partial [Paraglaciecola sp.]|uniref:FecR family protein n=1 Tax=Paraglaciecola sp. TaxID=1920173 RepID=UPI0032982D9E
MTGVVKHIDNRQHILSQASAWLAKIESNELTQQEQQELNAWVKQSKSHQEALVEMAQNIDRLQEAAAHSSTSAEIQSDSKILKNWSWITKIAAAAVFLMLIPTAYKLQVMTNFTSTNGDYVTTKGSQKMIELADGSLVTLNTDSRLIVEFEDGNRFLNLLKGEANFDVASDKHHPFVVRAGDGDVQAIGTSFAVRLEDETVNVLVSHGKVLVRADKTKEVPSLSEVPSSTSQFAQSGHPQE